MTIKTTLFVLLNVLIGSVELQAQTTPIGQWQDHLPYRNTRAVALGGGNVYCATTTGLFKYIPSAGEIERLTKVNALSDVGVQGIAWNDALGMLVVFYANGNLDLIQGSTSYNMNDRKRSTDPGRQGYYGIHFEGAIAYLSCGFGIVKVDLAAEKCWLHGSLAGGSQVAVTGVAFYGDSIYAATRSGLFSAWRNATNLAAFDNWHRRTDMASTMSNGPFNDVVSFGGKLLLNYDASAIDSDTLLVLDDTGVFQPFQPLYGRENRNLNVSNDGQFVIIPRRTDIVRLNTALDEVTTQYGYEATEVERHKHSWREWIFWIADEQLG